MFLRLCDPFQAQMYENRPGGLIFVKVIKNQFLFCYIMFTIWLYGIIKHFTIL